MRSIDTRSAACVVTIALAFVGPSVHAASQPNIVVILADDLGNADLGYRGSSVRTPNLDRLARQGLRLESFYGQPVCTPARACLMTGRYPLRHGLQTLVIFPSHTYGLPTDELTLPEALRRVGYRTMMVGKWHLGHADRAYWPQSRGFDHFYGNLVGEVDYFTKDRGGVVDWQRNGEFLEEEGYYTDLIGDEAVRLVEQQSPDRPFFLYFASLAPHSPYQAPGKDIAAYGEESSEKRRAYYAMISSLDRQVGRLVGTLEARGLLENTLIVFTSDNGGVTNALFATGARSEEERTESGGVALGEKPPASNGQLRGGKGTIYEGGLRVPAFLSWQGRIDAGAIEAPIHMVDIMPTLLALACAEGDPEHPFDGRDLTNALDDPSALAERDLLLHVEPIRGAVRRGQWKLVRRATLPGATELYDLGADPGETRDVADDHPEVVAELSACLERYAAEQRTPEWLKAQPQFLGAQGQTIFDPGFDIDDSGLPHERTALPIND